MKSSELEDSSQLATREWVESCIKLDLHKFKSELNMERMERQSKLMNCAGLISFGFVWGFLIAELLFLHK
jgi:hypothetical protein